MFRIETGVLKRTYEGNYFLDLVSKVLHNTYPNFFQRLSQDVASLLLIDKDENRRVNALLQDFNESMSVDRNNNKNLRMNNDYILCLDLKQVTIKYKSYIHVLQDVYLQIQELKF